jgi:hypothetical protein
VRFPFSSLLSLITSPHFSPTIIGDSATAFLSGIVHDRPTIFRNIINSLIDRPEIVSNSLLLKQQPCPHRIHVHKVENFEAKPNDLEETISFADFLTLFEENAYYRKSHCLEKLPIDSSLPHLIMHAGVVHYAPNRICPSIHIEFCQLPTLSIGMKGIRSILQYDRRLPLPDSPHEIHHHASVGSNNTVEAKNASDPGKHNVILQVTGARKFILFSPEYEKFLLAGQHSVDHYNISRSEAFIHAVENCSDKLEEQIAFIENSPFPSLVIPWKHRKEIILYAGDALLLPTRWWYYTEILQTGITLHWPFESDCLTEEMKKLVIA